MMRALIVVASKPTLIVEDTVNSIHRRELQVDVEMDQTASPKH